MMYSPITKYQAASIRAREDALRAWLRANKRNSYRQDELPAELQPTCTNEDRGACEVFEFLRDKPVEYFLYVTREPHCEWKAATWMGDALNSGRVQLGAEYCGNMGDKRRSVRFVALTGDTYAGTFFCGAGDYARVRKVQD